jgi:hypothetical protein
MLRNKRQAGQALVAATFGLVALLGATGLAIDMGYLRYQKRLQQSAADSAALAGAAEIGYGGDSTAAAQQDSLSNGFDGITGGTKNVTVTVNKPPATGGYTTDGNAVEVLVSANQPVFFMNIFGVGPQTVISRAVARFSGNGIRNCMYVLGNRGDFNNSGTVNTPSCGIISNGALDNGGGSITAASIGVVGSADRNRVNPAAVTNIVPAADPLAYLPAPAIGGCQNGTINNPTFSGGRPRRRNPPLIRTISPGTYCSFNITGDVQLTLNPGTYVVTGPVSFGGTGSVTGNGVTIYVSGGGGAVNLGNNVDFSLTAPTSGAYNGVLFFQDSGDTSTATINGTGGSKLQGAFYFPTATLNVDGAASNAAYMAFVAKSLNINTTVSFPSNYSSLTNGSPIKTAVLVE